MELILLAAFTGFALLCGIAFPTGIAMKTRREFGSLLGVMERIADDEVGVDVPFKSGQNEISQIARMADTFQNNTVARKQAESDAELARRFHRRMLRQEALLRPVLRELEVDTFATPFRIE